MRKVFLAGFFFFYSSIIWANQFEGVIQRQGIGRKMTVSIDGGAKSIRLCPSQFRYKLSYLHGMKVNVEGAFVGQTDKCFQVEKFSILSFSYESRAVVGKFVRLQGQYFIVAVDTRYHIESPTEGLQKFLGENVVVELYSMTKDNGELSYRIASYLKEPSV